MSGKQIVGIVLSGVGAVGLTGFLRQPYNEKLSLLGGSLILIAVGAFLFILGLVQRRRINRTAAQNPPQYQNFAPPAGVQVPYAQPVAPINSTEPSPNNADLPMRQLKLTIDVPYGKDEAYKCFLLRVNEFNVIELGEGGMFDVIYDTEKYKFVAFDKNGERLGDLPSNASESLDEDDRYEGKILYFDERNGSVRPKVEVYY